jgi:hypothetical protein
MSSSGLSLAVHSFTYHSTSIDLKPPTLARCLAFSDTVDHSDDYKEHPGSTAWDKMAKVCR